MTRRNEGILMDLQRFFSLMGKNRRRYIVLKFVVCIIGSLSHIFDAQAMRVLIAYFIDREQNQLNQVIFWISMNIIFHIVLRIYAYYLERKNQFAILRDIRIQSFRYLQKMPIAYFHAMHSGDSLARLNGDIDSLDSALRDFAEFSGNLMSLILLLPYLSMLDWRLALIAFLSGLLFLVMMVKVVHPFREINKNIRERISDLSKAVTENVTGFGIIKMYGLESLYNSRFRKGLEAAWQQQKRYSHMDALIGTMNIIVWFSGEIIITIAGAIFAMNGSLSVPNLAASVSLGSMIINVLVNTAEKPAQMQKAFAGISRLYALLSEKQEPQYAAEKTHSEDCSAGAALSHVTFAYQAEETVLSDVSIRAENGQMIALVGDSGSGKSTVIKLLAGLYPVSSGSMTLDRQPFAAYTLDALRQKIAYVPQDAYIFNGTIRENIAYGKPGAGDTEIWAAAKKANAHDFILQKPQGYETTVGERGVRLSGGERQRIAIARAMLKDAPVLLLDEATSSLDSEAERLVQEALQELMQGRTSVVVAHRLSTVQHADCLYFLQAGRVIGSGCHEELLQTCEEYARLYEHITPK